MWTDDNRASYERKGTRYPSDLTDDGLAIGPADVQDRDAIGSLLKVSVRLHPTLEAALADGGYQGELTANAVMEDAGLPLQIVKRWIVERTFGWLGRCRRLVKDFENLSRMYAAFVILAMIRLMLRRIVRLRAAQ